MIVEHRELSSTWLISDLHLDAARPQLTEILLRFLRGPARGAAMLLVLGDLFEAWIGDDAADDPTASMVCREFSALRQSGTRIGFLHGNRDFLLGRTFARAAGIDLLPDPTVLSLGGIDTLLSHGDRYCSSDRPYQAFRQQVRNPQWQASFLARSIDERKAFAQQARAQSAAHQRDMASLVDVTEDDIVRELSLFGLRRLIHGHTHRPADHQIQLPTGSAERIVLADWRDCGEALEIRVDGSRQRHVLL